MEAEPRTDAELLQATPREPEAFGAFYRRHVDAVLAYALSRCGRPEVAADLTAEVFAAALEQHRRFDSDRGPTGAILDLATAQRVHPARVRHDQQPRPRDARSGA